MASKRSWTRKRRVTLLAVLTGLCILFIWGQSALPVRISAAESGRLWSRIVLPVLNFFGLPDVSHNFVRKCAHFAEFLVLGLLSFPLVRFRLSRKHASGGALLFCFLVAFLDETIQLFSSRGARISDVWLDTAGAVVGILLILFFLRAQTEREKDKCSL